VNDTKIGALERAKYHIKETTYLKDNDMPGVAMYVIEPYDRTKPIKVEDFKKLIANPPESYFMLASTLAEKERSSTMGKNVTIMRLEERGSGGYYRRDEMVWRDAGKASDFDNNTTFYYIPLSGFTALNRVSDVKSLAKHLEKSGVYSGSIYGVRKTDIEFIKKQKNWVELDKLIIEKLDKMDKENIMGLVKQALDINELSKYNSCYVKSDSPFFVLMNTFKDVKAIDAHAQNATQWLCKNYSVATKSDPQVLIDKYTKEVIAVKQRYPLLKSLSSYNVDPIAVAEYINLIDSSKGV
jgi:hypothetical protein